MSLTESEKKTRAAAKRRERYAANPEKYKAATRQYRQANPEKVNAAARKRYAEGGAAARQRRTLEKYRLTPAQFDAMYVKQAGLCAICDVEMTRGQGRSTAPCIDHDHDTGKVRGLLCHGCNIAVGFMEKSTARAIRAVDYILASLDTDPPAD